MSRPRGFDHDEAVTLHANGLSYAAIGRQLGVSATSVARVCDPDFRERQYAIAQRLAVAKMVACAGGCGAMVWAHYGPEKRAKISGYCKPCLGQLRKVERHGTESEYKYGCRCSECRIAATTARRRRRQAAA